MEHKHFKCYKCHYHNNFYIQTQTKGSKCKHCNTFNYFKFFRRNNNINGSLQNRNISPRRNQNGSLLSLNQSINRIGRKNNNNNMNTRIQRRKENKISFLQNRINRINPNSLIDSFNDISINENFFDFNFDNNINDNSNFNNIYNNRIDNQWNINYDQTINNKIIDLPWVKKEKLT